MAGGARIDFRRVERTCTHTFVRRFAVRWRELRLLRPGKEPVRRFVIEVAGFGRGRESVTYRSRRLTATSARRTQVSVGERRRPRSADRPGFLPVDSVHQAGVSGPAACMAVEGRCDGRA